MMSNLGENLLSELYQNPVQFNGNKFKGYDLLNEYLKGFDVETLIPALLKNDELVFRIAISIASELSKESCSVLLPYLTPILKIEKDPLYLHYLLNAIFKGTYYQNQKDFSYLVNQLNSPSYEVQLSAMHLISVANSHQIDKSISCLKNNQVQDTLVQGLTYLINVNGMDENSIVKVLDSKNPIIQLFGGIMAKKLFNKYPYLIEHAALSSNHALTEFALEVIEIEKDEDF